MSWQDYITKLEEGVNKAAIHGKDGSKWAASNGFEISSTEAQELYQALFNNRGGKVNLSGTEYMVVKTENEPIEKIVASKGNDRLIMCASYQAMIIGVYESKDIRKAHKAVEDITHYLKGSGY